MASTSAKRKSNVVAIDHAKVQAIADRLNSENGEVELLDPEYLDPDEPGAEIKINASTLKTLWEDAKLLNDIAYAVFALEHDRILGKEFELHSFIWRWRGEIENAKGDVKELQPSVVMKAIEKMEKGGFLRRQKVKVSMEIQLDLFAGVPADGLLSAS